MRRLRAWPLYPVVFAVSWVLVTAVDSGVRLQSTLRVFVLVPGVAALLVVVLAVLLRNAQRAGVAATVLVVLLSSRDFGRLGLGLVGIVAVALAIVVIRRIVRRPIPMDRFTAAANLISAILLATTVVQGMANGTLPAWVGDLTDQPPTITASDREPPDIYLILLDGYPRQDTVTEVLGGDNSAFLHQLEARGFAVDPEAHSGYMYTDLVLSSMLHGRHVVDIPELQGVISGASQPARGRQVMNEAPLLEELASAGYTLVANAQAWDEPALRRVHRFVEGTGLNEFERHVLLESLPGAVLQAIDLSVRQDLMRSWVEDAFDFLPMAAAAEIGGPRFVFAHVPSPHFPVVYTADGGYADPRFGYEHPAQVRAASPAETKAAYLAQVAHLNRRVLDLVDSDVIPEDAVVVLMSDHGPEFGLNWGDGAASDLQTRFAVLFATRAPDGVFEAGQLTTGVLVRILTEVLGHNTAEPPDRFFVSAASPKYATLTEVPSPFHD